MRSTDTMLSRTLEITSPLRPIDRRAARKPAARRVPWRSVSKIVARQVVDPLPDIGEDFRGAVDDRLDQPVEHGFGLMAAAAGLDGAGHEHR